PIRATRATQRADGAPCMSHRPDGERDMREKLLAKRQSLLDEANAILDTAVNEGRGLTDEEKAKHDGLVAQAKGINDILTANAAAEAQAAVTVPISQITAAAVAAGTMPAETPGAA